MPLNKETKPNQKWNKVGDLSRGWLEASLLLQRQSVGENAIQFPGLLHFTIDPNLIMLSVKQGNIKYTFWVFGMTRPGIEPSLPDHWQTL